MYTHPYNFVPYGQFVAAGAPVIPKLYWDSLSQEQRIHRMCQELHKLCDYANELGIAINLDHQIIEQLEADFEKFKESGFLDYYQEQLEQYIKENFPKLMQAILNHGVYFGLTEDGYFTAEVVWQLTVYFDTIMDYASDDYGRLTLTY